MNPTDTPVVALGERYAEEGRVEEVSIDFSAANTAHLIVSGSRETGKRTLVRSLLAHCIHRKDVWLAMVHDDLYESGADTETSYEERTGAAVYDDMARLLVVAEDLLDQRYQLFVKLGVGSLEGINQIIVDRGRAERVLPRILCVISGVGDPQDPEVSAVLGRLIRLGRDAGVHVALLDETAAQRLPRGADMTHFGARAILGQPSEAVRRRLLEGEEIPDPLRPPDPLGEFEEGGETVPGAGVFWRGEPGNVETPEPEVSVVRFYHHAPEEFLH